MFKYELNGIPNANACALVYGNKDEFMKDQGTVDQVNNILKHPALAAHLVLAPDFHCGYGVPIGSIFATKDCVIPNAVGVDIGCTVSFFRTNIKVQDVSENDLRRIIGGKKEFPGGILANIPVGMKHNKDKQDSPIFADQDRWINAPICSQEYESALHQIGSMGGGNHFIELQKDENDFLCVMIHSGSRNLGFKVANHYNNIAVEICSRFYLDDVVKAGLAFLPRGTKEYDLYMHEMNLCGDFAKHNHLLMQKKVKGILAHVFGCDITFEEPIITNHNFAQLENHFGRNVMVHRKGAILARAGVKCLIPGSQGTASYIVEGLGNVEAMCSASHGSGRKLSRTQARAQLSLKDEQARMGNIIHNMNTEASLDEAPSAYKNIEDVLDYERDLVKPISKLVPIAVVKGA